MTKHKQAKALKRRRRVSREIREHRHSFRSNNPDMQNLTHPKPLSKEEVLAQRKPTENEVPVT